MTQSAETAAEQEVPSVHAVQASTGMGKTQMFIEVVAQDALKRCEEPFGYLLPTHRLGDDVAELWQEQNRSARVYRGREAVNPANPDEKMCLNLEASEAGQGRARPHFR